MITEAFKAWILTGFGTVLTAIVAFLWKRVKQIVKEEKLMKDAVQTVMIHQMVTIYNDAMNRGGWLTATEYTEAKRLHDIYHSMGWNHTGDLYFEKSMKLPVHDGTEKTI